MGALKMAAAASTNISLRPALHPGSRCQAELCALLSVILHSPRLARRPSPGACGARPERRNPRLLILGLGDVLKYPIGPIPGPAHSLLRRALHDRAAAQIRSSALTHGSLPSERRGTSRVFLLASTPESSLRLRQQPVCSIQVDQYSGWRGLFPPREGRDRGTARATLGKGLAVSAFPLYVPV
jgi:hypothetical protein